MQDSLHVFLTTDVSGDVWDFTATLSNELVQLGHDVSLLAFGEPSRAQRQRAMWSGAELVSTPLKLEWMHDSAKDVRDGQEVARRLVSILRPDVVHANQFSIAAAGLGTPTVLTAHGDLLTRRKWTARPPEDQPIPMEWVEYAGLVKRGFQAANAVVAVSRFLAQETCAAYGISREIEVIHNGWSGSSSSRNPIALRQRMAILASRAWDSPESISLAGRAARGWDPGHVVLAGDATHPDGGQATPLPPPIEPLGRLSRDELDRLLGDARVYISPSHYDPFGLLPLQAALAGCPLLLSDIPSYRELWNGVALFFQPDDPLELRAQWQRMLADESLSEDLARRARRRARGHYGAPRMAREYVRIYSEALALQPASETARRLDVPA